MTSSHSEGLSLNAKLPLSTALIPGAKSRQWVPLTTPIVWDGAGHLLLEYSLENDATSSLDKTCINFKFAAKQTSNSLGEFARTAFAYIYSDSCWASQSYPWSQVGADCSKNGKSMEAVGMTGVVMDVAFRTTGACTVPSTTTRTTTTNTTTANAITANTATANTATTKAKNPSGKTTTVTTTVTTTAADSPSNNNNDHRTEAVAFGVVALLLLFCCLGVSAAYLRLKSSTMNAKAADGAGSIPTYSVVVPDQLGLVGGDDDATSI